MNSLLLNLLSVYRFLLKLSMINEFLLLILASLLPFKMNSFLFLNPSRLYLISLLSFLSNSPISLPFLSNFISSIKFSPLFKNTLSSLLLSKKALIHFLLLLFLINFSFRSVLLAEINYSHVFLLLLLSDLITPFFMLGKNGLSILLSSLLLFLFLIKLLIPSFSLANPSNLLVPSLLNPKNQFSFSFPFSLLTLSKFCYVYH